MHLLNFKKPVNFFLTKIHLSIQNDYKLGILNAIK